MICTGISVTFLNMSYKFYLLMQMKAFKVWNNKRTIKKFVVGINCYEDLVTKGKECVLILSLALGGDFLVLLTQNLSPGVGNLTTFFAKKSNPRPMPCLPPRRLNIDRCIRRNDRNFHIRVLAEMSA